MPEQRLCRMMQTAIWNVLIRLVGMSRGTLAKTEKYRMKKRSDIMTQIINYVKPELVVVSIALYFLGMWMKSSKRIKDNDIPIFLGAVGIIICGLYVIATCDLSGMQSISMALFTAVVQGILVAGLSTYVNQIIKQIGKDE
nr:MAG TPA: holin [Caudoviricetes sp.]